MKSSDFIIAAIVIAAIAVFLKSLPLVLFLSLAIVILILARSQVSHVKGLEIQPNIDPAMVEIGTRARVQLFETGRTIAPGCWVKARLPLISPEGSRNLLHVASFGRVDPKQESSILSLTPKEIGVYCVGPSELRVSDAFGLKHRIELGTKVAVLLAYPKPLPCHLPHMLPRGAMGETIPLKSPAQDNGFLIGGRPYRRGDSPRNIHWKASGHTGQLVTKQLEETGDPRYWLFPLFDESEFMTVAVSIVEHLLLNNIEVGVMSPGKLHPFVIRQGIESSTSYTFVHPSRASNQFELAVSVLVASDFQANSIPPDQMVFSKFRRGDLALILANTLGAQWTSFAESLQRRGVQVALLSIAPSHEILPRFITMGRAVLNQSDVVISLAN